MATEINQHQFDNGLVLLAERMPWLESAAFVISLPSGCHNDPDSRLGLSNLTCEMVQRGCGDRDSRQFVEDLEFLGVDYSASVSSEHTGFGGAMPAESLSEALDVFSTMLKQPHLPDDQLEDGKRVCLQEIYAIEDDLPQQVLIELRRRHYPFPYGRSATGLAEHIVETSSQDVRHFFESVYRPNGTVLAVAGNIDWEATKQAVEASFGSWPAIDSAPVATTPPEFGPAHIEHESNQTHIGLSFPSIPYAHEDYFRARGAVGVLSDGMSSRLFSEIREKRGLCYTVYASYHSLREHGNIVCYAGTSTDRAQQTLDVLVGELRRLEKGITDEELDRLKVQIRSSLVMQQESSRSRAGSLAGDWYHLGKVRTLDEVSNIILNLTTADINEYLSLHPIKQMTLVTLGERPLEAPVEIS